jgi:hypothetical protein
MPATGVIYVPGNPRGLSEAEEECRLNFAANHHGNAWVTPALYLREEKPTKMRKIRRERSVVPHLDHYGLPSGFGVQLAHPDRAIRSQ